MSLPWYIPLTKIFFMSISNYYTVTKITNKKIESKLLLLVLCLFAGIIYTLIREKTDILVSYPIYYFMFSITYSAFTKTSMQKGLIISLITNAITVTSMLLASILSFGVLKILKTNLAEHNLIEYIIIGIIEVSLIYLFFRIKRFRNGFSFLNTKNEIFTKIGVVISSILIIFAILIGRNTDDTTLDTMCALIIAFGGIAMFDWIKKSITKYYKEKMKERTVEIQQEQIKEKDETIKNLESELANLLEINHKYNHRLSAMEKAVTKLGYRLQANEEFAEEYADIFDSLNELSKEYKEEVASISKESKLPKTNIFSIDNLLEYMKLEAEKSKIGFELKVNFDINEIIENKISKNRLETLLADHIKDAIIAINSSENKERKIKVSFDKDKEYQIKFYDTGIEFEVETLLNLGLERTTTHKMTGGTGIGFMTTFETLKECKASLIIEEYNKQEYTKAVIIKFDDKSEYRIHSYRAEEIKNKTQNNRIIIY